MCSRSMRRFLIIVFLMLPLPLLATPVDSMFGPFKLPFHIGVTVHGHFRWSAGSYFPGPPDKFGREFTVDSLGTYSHTYPIDSTGTKGVDTTQALVIGDTLR